MHDQPFDIRILSLKWIKQIDDPTDLCVHGSVYVRIADKVILDSNDGDKWTLSAAALNLMRTLEKDYTPGDLSGQLIPCCGFFLIADDDGEHVNICGGPNGLDWKIVHVEKLVKHIAETGEKGIIDKDYYKKLVLEFADQVKQLYNDSIPKMLPADELDRKGYQAFWTEWENLRNKWS